MGQTQTAAQKLTIGDRVIRSIHGYRRLNRLLFPSPAEVKFVLLMRGHALTLPFIRSHRTGFPLTFLWLGRILKSELIKREVKVGGRFFVDFGTPGSRFLKAIEIDGGSYHNVVADQERDRYLQARGYEVLHIPARRLHSEPRQVYVQVLQFLRS